MANHELGPIKNNPKVLFDKKTGAVSGVTLKPRYLDEETIRSIVEGLVKFPREVVFEYGTKEPHNKQRLQPETTHFSASAFESIQNCSPDAKDSLTHEIIKLMSKAKEVIIWNPKFVETQNVSPFSLLENSKQDAVIGIDYTNPNLFKKSYWAELLQKQVDCALERTLVLIFTPQGKRSKTKSFNLREEIQNLPEEKREGFLSDVLEQIAQSMKVLLIETGEEKFIPIEE